MKKIFLFFATVCAIVACDPTHEDISNGGHITAEELKNLSSVTLDTDGKGKNGNILTCTTSAPVNATWTVAGKTMIGSYAKKKMRLGEYVVTLTGLCADGTAVTADFPINCQVETDPIKKKYFYGEDATAQPEFWLEATGDGNAGRFSDNEGAHFPFLDGETYFGKKTLVFEITDAEDGKFIWGDDYGCTCRVMNGWWSSTYADNVPLSKGYWELEITDQIAKECASSNDGGDGKDLSILMTRGKVKIKACYYEY